MSRTYSGFSSFSTVSAQSLMKSSRVIFRALTFFIFSMSRSVATPLLSVPKG